MTGKTLGATTKIAALLLGFATFGACSSDDDEQPANSRDAGPDRRTTGGSGGSGGSTGGSGGSGGTAGGADAGCVAVGTTCDGAEDCPTGQRCCARFQGMPPTGRYAEFRCMDSCSAPEAGVPEGGGFGATWLELCHAGDTCEDPTTFCTGSQYLPPSLARCFDTDGGAPNASLGKAPNAVNCGSAVCGAGEQCCIRQPLDPYCAPAGATCQCERPQPEAGGGDGAAGTASDASVDAPGADSTAAEASSD